MQLLTLVRRYGSAGWQHRWKALLLSWAICITGWAFVSSIPDSYQSSSRIYADADAVLGQVLRGIALDSSPANQVELLQRTLLSRPNLERVVARTDLDLRVDSVRKRDALLTELARDIKITAQTRNLFTIEYVDRDPRLAREVVQTMLNLFIEQASSTDRQQMENARGFVAQQIATYETQLREAERRRAEFRIRYIDLLPSDALGGTNRLEQARAKVQQLRGELQDMQLRRTLLRQQLEAQPQTLSAAELVAAGGGGDNQLAAAERQLRELRLRYTEQHPDVAAARAAVAEMRANGGGSRAVAGTAAAAPRQGPARIANPLYEQLRLRLIDADATISSLERQVGEEQSEVERLDTIARGAPQLQAQFQNLDRDYTVLLKSYEELLARRESVQIAGAARVGADRVRLEIVDPPTLPTQPSKPNRILLGAGVLVLGIGAGVALAALLVLMDSGFYTMQDLRQLGLPVIGGVSMVSPPARSAMAAVAFAGCLALLVMTCGVVLVGGPALVARVPALVAKVLA
jgi:polysaccharide chain length determinant protein (PEP-CTERM system associated)